MTIGQLYNGAQDIQRNIIESTHFVGLNLAEIVAIKGVELLLRKKAVGEAVANNKQLEVGAQKDNSKRTWTITNLDDPISFPVTGQYGAESYDETISSNYTQLDAVGRKSPIIQFKSTNADSITFNAVIFAKDVIEQKTTVKESIQKLKAWAKYDDKLHRPPIISLKIATGVGNIYYEKALITACNPSHKIYDKQGNIVHCEVALTIIQYIPYKHDTQTFDTKYHNVKDGEYHELLAAREYKNPMKGVVLRHYNEQDIIGTEDIVKIPDDKSKTVSVDKITTKSLILENYLNKKDYYNYLQEKEDSTPLHIVDIIKQKIEVRSEQYGTTI